MMDTPDPPVADNAKEVVEPQTTSAPDSSGSNGKSLDSTASVLAFWR